MSYFNQTNQEVNKVYKTNKLEIFKPIVGNRPTNPMHIRKLSTSIKQNGILQNPIIVNEKMQVIDGQNRLFYTRKIGIDGGVPTDIYGGARVVGRVGQWDIDLLFHCKCSTIRIYILITSF